MKEGEIKLVEDNLSTEGGKEGMDVREERGCVFLGWWGR